MSITTDDYRRARHIAEDAAGILHHALRQKARGRPGVHPRILLTGMVLAMDKYGEAKVSTIHTLLTRDMPLELQWNLGVRHGNPAQPTVLTVNHLYQLTKLISTKLDYTDARAPGIDDEARNTRRNTVKDIRDALLAATLIPRPDGAADYALDGTGLWAPENAPRKVPTTAVTEPDNDPGAHVDILADLNTTPTDTTINIGAGKGSKGPSDARYGVKTKKGGGREVFFGYDIESFIRVPAPNAADHSEPCLVETFTVLPAGTDIVKPCLESLDDLLTDGTPVRRLVVDRHYSYKDFFRWLTELLNRNIQQVADTHANDQGFRDWDGIKFAAAHPHCPATPDRLATIPALPPNATQEETTTFNALIDEREQYAAQYVQRLDADGKMKIRCPARNGTLGCPLVAGTVAAATEAGLPIANPPDDHARPRLCSQDTVTLTVQTPAQGQAMKLAQPFYWGSKKWRQAYNRRSLVEQWFSILKSSDSTGLGRETHAFRGLALVTLVVSTAAAVTNMQKLRTWHHTTGRGDETHPLLQPDQPFHGFTQCTPDMARQIGINHHKGTQPPILANPEDPTAQPQTRKTA